jgi:myo-inositol 2-dehydrogenase/D-chiro-inositol 1-dehydrogenase
MHRIALIGAGRIGQIHARNVAAHPGLDLAMVVDPSTQAAQDIADRWGAKASSIDEAMGAPDIDGLIIASATHTHLDYMLQGAEAGKTIFCEKPVDQDLQRARAAEAKLADARILIGFNRRFDPHFLSLKNALDAKRTGNLETLQIISNDPAPPPVEYIAVSGGLFKDMAIHDFDMARWMMQDDPEEVFAMGSCLVDPAIGDAGDIDTARTLLKFPGGRLCVISNSRRSGFGYDQRIEVFGSEGMLQVDNVRETTLQVWTEDGAQADKFQNFFLDRYAQAYRNELDHFTDVLNGAPERVTYADGVAALALAEAAAESLRTAQPVKL